MFRFNRKKIMPMFLSKRMTVTQLARAAGIAYLSAKRAVSGEAVAANIIGKVADTLNIDAMDYLEDEKEKGVDAG